MACLRTRLLLPFLMAGALLLTSCGARNGTAPRASAIDDSSLLAQDTTLRAPVSEILRQRERFRVFATMLDSARLLSTLRRGGPYTVFAPTNPGLDDLPEGLLEELLLPANRDRLQQIVAYHLHRGEVPRDSIPGTTALSTFTGQTLPVAVEGGHLLVGEERMSEHEITAANGRIFALDALVMPPPEGATGTLPSGARYDASNADSSANSNAATDSLASTSGAALRS